MNFFENRLQAFFNCLLKTSQGPNKPPGHTCCTQEHVQPLPFSGGLLLDVDALYNKKAKSNLQA